MKKEEMRRILERADSLAELLRKALSERRYDEALALIKRENPFPAICGRVCKLAPCCFLCSECLHFRIFRVRMRGDAFRFVSMLMFVSSGKDFIQDLLNPWHGECFNRDKTKRGEHHEYWN